MKRRLLTFAFAVLTVGLLGSCSKINERIDGLDKRVYDLENNKIASVEQQITAINTSINELKAADVTINGKIADLKTAADAHQALIDALQEADRALGQKDAALEARIATLEGQVTTINGQIDALVNADIAINTRIDQLQSYVDTEIGKAKDWATATFASLTEYEKTAEDLAALSVTVTGISTTLAEVQTSISGLDAKIDGIDVALQEKITTAKTELEGEISDLKTELEGEIAEAIATSEAGLKGWVNEQLSAYYTAAQMDAKIDGLQNQLDDLKTDTDANKSKIEELETKLAQLEEALEEAKTTIKAAYEKAIKDAIEDYNGTITETIQTKIDAVNETITALTGRVEALETTVGILTGRIDAAEASIATIEQQIAAINQSISDLETIRTNIQELMEAKEAMGEDISELQAKDQALEGKITDLKNYVDTELANYATTDWANATFATLAEQEEIITEVAKLKQDLEGLDTKLDQVVADIKANLDQAIADLETSLKDWVNEQLTGYYTTAQIDEKIDGLQNQIDDLKADTDANKSKIEELETELDQLTQALEEAKTTIKTEYEAAIATAIEEYNGTITQTIQTKIDEVNATIANLTGRVDELALAVSTLQADVAALKAMIQSVSITPAYSDGSVEADENGILTIKCIVSPAEALDGIESLKDSLLIYADYVKVKTKSSPAYTEITVSEATVLDAAQGAITLKADISEYLPEGTDKALTVALNVKNGISNYTTEFVPVYVAEPALPAGALSGVFSVSATKKVYFSKGNLYADGDKALHFEANQYSSASSWDASHVSHFTWSSTVEAAVGNTNSGDNLFCDESHKVSVDGGEAIYYALSKDEWTYLFSNHSYKWATVNGVKGYVIAPDGFSGTLVDSYADDAALAVNNLVFLPAAGYRSASYVLDVGVSGHYWSSTARDEFWAYFVYFNGNDVSPDGYDGRGIGYGVRLITESAGGDEPEVKVTGVTMSKEETTFSVGNKETLVATVAPANATNKQITWSSSKPSVATVDENGEVTGVAVGSAVITATTAEGNFTAACQVTVKTLPAGALSGVFSVSTTKKILFSQGNLYYDGSKFSFETNQYDTTPSTPSAIGSWSANHISHFYWSKTASVAYALSYSESGTTVSDVFFTNETETTAKAGFTVNVGGNEQSGWRTLSTKEWQYLFDTRTVNGGTKEGKSYQRATINSDATSVYGMILYPDNYTSQTGATSYTSTEWTTMEENGCVFLPAAGYRASNEVWDVGFDGHYWSSTAYDNYDAYEVYFGSSDVNPGGSSDLFLGHSVRLVTE